MKHFYFITVNYHTVLYIFLRLLLVSAITPPTFTYADWCESTFLVVAAAFSIVHNYIIITLFIDYLYYCPWLGVVLRIGSPSFI